MDRQANVRATAPVDRLSSYGADLGGVTLADTGLSPSSRDPK
jgi:hypothetical protein